MSRTVSLPRIVVVLMSAIVADRPLHLHGQLPTYGNVIAEVREGPGNGYQEIHVTNRSGESIVVNRIFLFGCINIRLPCGTNIVKVHIAPGGDGVALRVFARAENRSYGFRYRFNFEAPNGQSAPAGPNDSTDAERVQAKIAAAMKQAGLTSGPPPYDSLSALPPELELSVGETVDLTTALRLRAVNGEGQAIAVDHFTVTIESGTDLVAVKDAQVRGLKVGTAVAVLSLDLVADPSGRTPGLARVTLRVVP